MSLQTLPWQALEIISENIGQADCVSLGLTCSHLMPFIASRLYRSIILDLGPRPLGKSVAYEYIQDKGYYATTVVRTSAGLRRCLQVLADNPHWARKVWSLSAKSNLPLSDSTMRTLLSGAFRNLTGLISLDWRACPELPVDVLTLLPNKSNLIHLEADLAIRFHQQYPEMQLESLTKLNVQPFLGSDCLKWLKTLVSKAQGLKELTLCRYLDEKREVGSSYAFVGLSDIPTRENCVRLISDFFEPSETGEKLKLDKLGLMQFLHDNDAHLLFACVDLQNVHTLGLAGVDAASSECLLDKLMYKTPKLKHLSLDWIAPAPLLARYLDHLDLETLEVRIYADPLQVLRAASRQRSLKSLKISTKCRFSEVDFEPLKKCAGLETLVMPFSFQVRTWSITMDLPRLSSLELVYSGEKTPHVHNNTLISCGLLSMWNDEFAYPLQYAGLIGDLRHHSSLRVVDIDGHRHILKPSASCA